MRKWIRLCPAKASIEPTFDSVRDFLLFLLSLSRPIITIIMCRMYMTCALFCSVPLHRWLNCYRKHICFNIVRQRRKFHPKPMLCNMWCVRVCARTRSTQKQNTNHKWNKYFDINARLGMGSLWLAKWCGKLSRGCRHSIHVDWANKSNRTCLYLVYGIWPIQRECGIVAATQK